MISLKQDAVIDETNPALFFISQLDGLLVDLFSLNWEIFDRTTKEKQVVPTSKATGSVDLVLDRVSLGQYFARHTFDNTYEPGRYEIRWTWTFESGGEQFVKGYDFEILKAGPGVFDLDGPSYALVADLVDEGFCGPDISQARLQMAIILASQFIEQVTGRFFEPRKMVQRHDGRGSRGMLLREPVIAVSKVTLDIEPRPTDAGIDLSNLRVYNRHLQGMTQPDDRNSPKLEFIHANDFVSVSMAAHVSYPIAGYPTIRTLAFPHGVQNVGIHGFFGYTQADGTPFGKTPTLIRHAAKMLVARELPLLGDPSCRDQLSQKWRIKEERVRDQTIKYEADRKMGSFTGDAEIDTILLMFTRPPILGAA